jgi:hypothetical protein
MLAPPQRNVRLVVLANSFQNSRRVLLKRHGNIVVSKQEIRKLRKKAIKMQNNSSRKMSFSEAMQEVRKVTDEFSTHNK